jgi:trk system potassium uptake protein TrkH
MSHLLKLKTSLSKILTPARSLILSFAGIIIVGAIILWLPPSSAQGSISFIDALFTSTSAVCVTGLSVVSIGRDLSFIGQVVTLILFQIGGLGFITFSVVLFGLMGRGISFKGREIVRSTFLHTPIRNMMFIAKWIMLLTFSIEGVGVILLWSRFIQDFTFNEALFKAVYHAVAAFNNCAYSLFTDSFVDYRDDWFLNLTIMGLIILGGSGFIVQYEVISRLRGFQDRLSVHAKIVLITTGLLILGGAALICLFEFSHAFRELPAGTRILSSVFQSVAARTCGFHTLNIGQLTNATILVLMILMFIGASPGSTGGGVKTTSFALLILIIWNRMKGHEEVSVFDRTIPRDVLFRTIAIMVASVVSILLVTSILLFFESDSGLPPAESRHFFVEYLFETVSAFGTVGLSMGITDKLNSIQKLAIILMMIAGRVGPLTLAFSWYSAKRRMIYAEESVMVG